MKPVVLCILDGYGYSEESYGNAVKQAKTSVFDMLWEKYPHSLLCAAEEYVGLPKGQMGNSEVGHLNLGAGRLVYQDLMKINKSIEDRSFFSNKQFLKAIGNAKNNDSNLHICGLVSDGGVHSHINHLFALLDLCNEQNFHNVFIHVLLDGRDTLPLDNVKYVESLSDKINQLGFGQIATIGGRYYAMNRDQDWSLTSLAYNCIVDGIGLEADNYKEAFEIEYKENLTDEFMKPTVLKKVPINDDDSLIFFNFRSDRMIQMLRLFNDGDFKGNIRKVKPLIVTMTEYDVAKYNKEVLVAYPKEAVVNSLAEVISKLGMKQFRLSEHEKRGHVTFYFSGANDVLFPGEDRKIFEKNHVFTYDEYPPMRSKEITDTLIEKINSKQYQFILCNYPNGDCLGHTGNLKAAIEGVEKLDECLGQLIKNTNLDDYLLIITADHGDVEYMLNEDGSPNKSHTTNKVPFIFCDTNYKVKNGKLADVAPTILKYMGIDIPTEMTGDILLEDN